MISGFNLTVTRREKRQGMKLCSGLRTVCDSTWPEARYHMVTFWSSVYYHNECRSIKKKCGTATIITASFNKVLEIMKTAKKVISPKKAKSLKLAKEQSFPKKST